MRILNELDKILIEPDLELGKLVPESRNIIYKYEITQHEQGHYETIAEYDNGGKDIEWVIDVPEDGYWTAYDEEGIVVNDTDIVIPDDMPHEIELPMVDEFYRYVLYTEEELVEIAEQKRLHEEEVQKAEEREIFLDEAPSRLDATESCISALTSAFGAIS